MSELESNLDKKSSSELQRYLKNNMFNEEAAEIARLILKRRGDAIPESIPQDAIEEQYETARKTSNTNMLITIFVFGVWVAYGYLTGLFESGDVNRLKNSMLVLLLSIAPIWGWNFLGINKNDKGNKK